MSLVSIRAPRAVCQQQLSIVWLLHPEREQCFCRVTSAPIQCQLVSGYKCNIAACLQAKTPNEAPCVLNNLTKDRVPSLFLDKYFWLKTPEDKTRLRWWHRTLVSQLMLSMLADHSWEISSRVHEHCCAKISVETDILRCFLRKKSVF